MTQSKYDFWREKLRNHLTDTSKLFFIFFSTTMAFLFVNYKNEIGKLSSVHSFRFGVSIICVSAIFYSLFMVTRLIDYWWTQKLYREGKTESQVEDKTNTVGAITWFIVILQITAYFIGLGYIINGIIFSN